MLLDNLNTSLIQIIAQTKANFQILETIVGILWIIYVLDVFCGHRLLNFGIRPRRLIGIPGIFFAPLLHINFNHLFFNTIPLIVLSNFLLINGLSYYILVTLVITIISGLLIWLFAKPGLYVGASAVITGYWALLVADILQQGTLTAIILGFISIYYFAGIFFGIFPSKKGVAWEGHLFGLLAGVAAGYLPAALRIINGFLQ